jgi:lactose/L-arabinose transport system permease protein
MESKKKKLGLSKKRNLMGWVFLLPAVLLICWMSFYPMIRALLLSFRTGVGVHMKFAGGYNYTRMIQDKVFIQALLNNFVYLIIQVPIMLLLALGLASMLNNKNLKFKRVFRTAIFLPCATSLVSYAIIFRALFALDGFVNTMLLKVGFIDMPINWLGNPTTAKMVIIIALIWRWTGYNMVFYLAGLQNIEYTIYEAAKIDGAGPFQQFGKITIPLLKPMILLTAIMSTNGTLQLFDESVNLTNGGPANATITMSHYIYKMSFEYSPNFGYSTAMSFLVLILVAVLAFIQMKVGDKR